MKERETEKVDLHEHREIPMRALRTRRAQFLSEMDRLFPWQKWEGLIQGQAPQRIKGRPPYPVSALLRLWLLQRWMQLSDIGMIDMATDSMAVREFVGFGLVWTDLPPDAATWTNFRRLLDRTGLGLQIEGDIECYMAAQGWKIRFGEVSEVSLSVVRT